MIEATITYINQFIVSGDFCLEMFLSISFGIFTLIAYGLDIPKCFNLQSNIPYIRNILTVILIFRGSNYVYDLMTKITSIK